MSTFQVLGINHLGITAKDTAKCRWFFGEVLGLDFLGEELVKSQRTLTLMYRSQTGVSVQEPRLELLQPEVGSVDSPIAKFLEKKGAGIHHIALSVNHIESAVAHMKSSGVRMIDETPRPGAHQTLIAFIHPESTGGILVELVQEQHSL